MDQNQPNVSKRKALEIQKRAERHTAFLIRFSPGFYIRQSSTRALIRGMIDDYEKHPAFNLHHKINDKGLYLLTPKMSIVPIKNERRAR